MKILWLVNIVMPELAEHLGGKPSVFGGWLTGAMKAVRESGHTLAVVTTEENTKRAERYEVAGVTYYIVNRADVDSMQREFGPILEREQPDVVHIYGTEFEHSWAMAKCADIERTVVTVQGAMTYLKDLVYAGIPERLCRDNLLHKLLRRLHKGGQSIDLQKQSFQKRAAVEQQVLRHVKYVNGGSRWGSVVAKSINPECSTFDCNLILREPFYTDALWDPDTCEKHSIYILFSYPIKGFHKFLEALPLILRQYPDTTVNVVANQLPFRRYSGLKRKIQDAAPDYNWLVQKQIEQHDLQEHLRFLGVLSEEQVKEQLLKSNVFFSASALENQSTSLGEAMILGVPSVASCVGAMQEMIDHGKDGFLYPFNEPYMMAEYVCRIFEDEALAKSFSQNGHNHAAATYDREKNAKQLLEMYRIIADNAKERDK